MNKILSTILALFIWSMAVFAQNNQETISGEIRDSQGTLAGATVFLIRDMKTQEIVQETISGHDGKFSMSVSPGVYLLGVSFVGYKLHGQQVHISKGENNVGQIVLKEEVKELQEVVVQGKIVRVRTRPDGFMVNVREMRDRANDALDLLKFIPKVQIKGEQLSVIGKKNVLIKIGNVLQRVDASEIASVLKGYDARLINDVEVITQPPLRYDPDGNAALIILHTSSAFKEYMGGIIGTEEMWGGKDNFRYGGYGSLHYNHRKLFLSIDPSINFNGSKYMEQQTYHTDNRLYKVQTPSSGLYNYRGIRGVLQYEYGKNDYIGLAFSWNKKKFDNQFTSREIASSSGTEERIVENQNTHKSGQPRFATTAYWETTFGEKENKAWAELSYFNLSNNSQTDYAGHELSSQTPFLAYIEDNKLNTSGLNLNNDYAIYMDNDHKYLLETGIKGSWSFTTNYITHDESKSITTPIHQKNNIRWDELIITPYISGTFRFNQQWWLRMGLRYAGTKSYLRQIDMNQADIPDVSKYSSAWLPTFHASYSPSAHHQVTFTLNSEIERPKFRDLNPFVWQINEYSFYKGNTKLHPQQYYTASLGYRFMNALYIKGRAKRGIGVITAISTMKGNQVYTQVENAQNSTFLGIETGYYFDKLSWISASIDGYYGRNKYTSDNPNILSEAQGNEWGVSTYLDLTFNKSRTWTGYVSGEYTGRKHTTVATIEPSYDLGLGMSYFLLNRRLSLTVAGLNLLSSPYKGVSHRQGYSISFNNRYNYPTLYLSVSYKFFNGKDKSTSRPSRATQDIERRF